MRHLAVILLLTPPLPAQTVYTERCAGSGNKVHRPRLPDGQKFLRALDIETGRIVWEIPQIGPSDTWSGVLATAGNVLFYAVDARDGKTLWHFDTSLRWGASPMTFALGGKQYVAISSGPNVMCFALPE